MEDQNNGPVLQAMKAKAWDAVSAQVEKLQAASPGEGVQYQIVQLLKLVNDTNRRINWWLAQGSLPTGDAVQGGEVVNRPAPPIWRQVGTNPDIEVMEIGGWGSPANEDQMEQDRRRAPLEPSC